MLQWVEDIRIHSGDLPFFEIASVSWCLSDLNSLCFAPFPSRLNADMRADTVCHALEFCEQLPGQPLCHLYPLPKVSRFSRWRSDYSDTQTLWKCCKGTLSYTQRFGDRKRWDDISNYILWIIFPSFNLDPFSPCCQRMSFLFNYYSGLAVGRKSDQSRGEEV